jgi:hypothetical protein
MNPLSEQIAELRQLASMSSETRMLDLVLINALDELAEAVTELRGEEPPGLGSV